MDVERRPAPGVAPAAPLGPFSAAELLLPIELSLGFSLAVTLFFASLGAVLFFRTVGSRRSGPPRRHRLELERFHSLLASLAHREVRRLLSLGPAGDLLDRPAARSATWRCAGRPAGGCAVVGSPRNRGSSRGARERIRRVVARPLRVEALGSLRFVRVCGRRAGVAARGGVRPSLRFGASGKHSVPTAAGPFDVAQERPDRRLRVQAPDSRRAVRLRHDGEDRRPGAAGLGVLKSGEVRPPPGGGAGLALLFRRSTRRGWPEGQPQI